MDNGMNTDDETAEESYDVLRELSPEEVVGIMDQLLCFEVRHLLLLSEPWGARPCLILIPDGIDGMAQGLLATSDFVCILLH